MKQHQVSTHFILIQCSIASSILGCIFYTDVSLLEVESFAGPAKSRFAENDNSKDSKKESTDKHEEWNDAIDTFFLKILPLFSEDTINEAIIAATNLKVRNVKELSCLLEQDLISNFALPVARRIQQVLKTSKFFLIVSSLQTFGSFDTCLFSTVSVLTLVR